MRSYRRGAVFVMDPRQVFRPLDRNQIARILFLAECLERRTKPAGRRNGVVSQVGLAVLRCLLLGFLNRSTGQCDPSYTTLQCKTGFCRDTIAAALRRLQATGLLTVTRRLVRQRVHRISPITGLAEVIVTTTQATNAYAMAQPGAHADELPVPAPKRRPFQALGRFFKRRQTESGMWGETTQNSKILRGHSENGLQDDEC